MSFRRISNKMAVKSLPAAGGAGKSGSKNVWAALDSDSDSDSDCSIAAPPSVIRADPETVLKAFLGSPDIVAMSRGDVLWGDLLCAADPALYLPPSAVAVAEASTPPPVVSEDEFWSQPFTARLEEVWADTYNTSVLSDTEFHDLMSWLCAKGWEIVDVDRTDVKFYPGCGSPRRWNPATMSVEDPRHVRFVDLEPEPEPAPMRSCCNPRTPRANKTPVTIPRFCREGSACSAAGCRYVHGNTIPRVNEPCSFGADCGKRSQCLRMHPGEVWTPELVITRL